MMGQKKGKKIGADDDSQNLSTSKFLPPPVRSKLVWCSISPSQLQRGRKAPREM